MKRYFQFLILIVATFTTTSVAYAQTKMVITMNEGKIHEFPVNDVAQMSWIVDNESNNAGTSGGENHSQANNHEFINLGLPSGTLWATCNVGANSPEEYGDYFAWGETEPKDYYDWSTYKWCNGSFDTMTKYCSDSFYGSVDNYVLDLADDAARANWGDDWRMPTIDELKELFYGDYCINNWIFQNGVYGCKVTSKSNGNSIFLPAAGLRGESWYYGTVPYSVGIYGYYWSSSHNSSEAYAMCIESGQPIAGSFCANRYFGYTVRPVLGSVGHDYVDLGLPSGTLWATCNVGANSPEEYGDYFAWGETEPKDYYGWSTYKWYNVDSASFFMSKYCTNSVKGIVDNKTILELADDVAHVNWGGYWRMPTFDEINELNSTNYCTWTQTTLNGVNGYKVTSKLNGNSIFLPAAGSREDSSLVGVGSSCEYWSSSLHSDRYNSGAYLLHSFSVYHMSKSFVRSIGLTVRPVMGSVQN